MKGPGIYKIYSISKPDRVYVGSSINLTNRKKTHFNLLKSERHYNKILQNHCNKYGIDDLVFVIIEPCFSEFLLIREQHYIDSYNPYFNICKIAGNTLGLKITDEHRAKLIKARKGRQPSLGMKHSKETRKKMSEMRKGGKMPPRTDKHRESLSKALKAKYATEVNPNFGKKHSAERIKNNSEAQKGKKLTHEHKNKIAAMTKIALNRPETRAKLLNRVPPNKGKAMQTNICPHCNREISLGNYTRWHGDNCKQLQLN